MMDPTPSTSYYAVENTREPFPPYAGPYDTPDEAQRFIDTYGQISPHRTFLLVEESITRKVLT